MTLRAAATAFAALSLAACATATTGTAPITLDPVLARSSHIGVVRMTSELVAADETFTETFTDAVHANLSRCARGTRPLDLRLHVEKVRRENRFRAALEGGEHELGAIAELVDPATRAVVGRYSIQVAVDAGPPLVALLADPQMMVSDAFATELCRQAFGD